MADKTAYPASVITPEGIAFEGEVQFVEVTSVVGGMGFFARHAPLVADLKMAQVRVQLPDDSWKTWATDEGFAKVHDSTATVLVEDAIEVDKIDEATAEQLISEGKAELERAEAELTKQQNVEGDTPDIFAADVHKAERQIAWGENLLRVKAEFAAK